MKTKTQSIAMGVEPTFSDDSSDSFDFEQREFNISQEQKEQLFLLRDKFNNSEFSLSENISEKMFDKWLTSKAKHIERRNEKSEKQMAIMEAMKLAIMDMMLRPVAQSKARQMQRDV